MLCSTKKTIIGRRWLHYFNFFFASVSKSIWRQRGASMAVRMAGVASGLDALGDTHSLWLGYRCLLLSSLSTHAFKTWAGAFLDARLRSQDT